MIPEQIKNSKILIVCNNSNNLEALTKAITETGLQLKTIIQEDLNFSDL